MWLEMTTGPAPFVVEADNSLSLQLRPALPSWLFTTPAASAHSANAEAPSFSFRFLNSVDVTYYNPRRVDTWYVALLVHSLLPFVCALRLIILVRLVPCQLQECFRAAHSHQLRRRPSGSGVERRRHPCAVRSASARRRCVVARSALLNHRTNLFPPRSLCTTKHFSCVHVDPPSFFYLFRLSFPSFLVPFHRVTFPLH